MTELTYEDLVVLEGKYWRVFLHGESPYYLGRIRGYIGYIERGA